LCNSVFVDKQYVLQQMNYSVNVRERVAKRDKTQRTPNVLKEP
jgi:hypothetical protein